MDNDAKKNIIVSGDWIFVVMDWEQITAGVNQTGDIVRPFSIILEHNYPNPFNAETAISYSLNVKSNVSLNI